MGDRVYGWGDVGVRRVRFGGREGTRAGQELPRIVTQSGPDSVWRISADRELACRREVASNLTRPGQELPLIVTQSGRHKVQSEALWAIVRSVARHAPWVTGRRAIRPVGRTTRPDAVIKTVQAGRHGATQGDSESLRRTQRRTYPHSTPRATTTTESHGPMSLLGPGALDGIAR